MSEGPSANPPDAALPNGVTVPQLSQEQQTQFFSSMAQSNPAALQQLMLTVMQQNPAAAALLAPNTAQSHPPNMGNFTGAFPQPGNPPPSQPFQQAPGANTPSQMSLAADLNGLKYTAAIPGSRDYDAVVANRLRQADRDGKSYKDALREMHGVFDFPSNLWIDYYLDRRVSINELVDEAESSRNTPVKTAKKPTLDRTASTSASVSAPAARPGPASMKKEKGQGAGPPSAQPRRATLNSMATYLDAPAPKNDSIPDPPSSEPTPPTEVHTLGLRGNAFTDADIKYLIDFVNWVCAHKDWSITKMYKKLAKRAPHHSAASWAGKAKTMPIIAKIIDASAQDDEEEEEEDDNYQEMDVDDTLDTESQPTSSRRRGGSGTAITDDDLEDMADWVVENGDNWDDMSGKMRWVPFAETHDKRSWQAWTEAYRKYHEEVDTLAKKKRRRAQASGPAGGKRPRNE